MEVITSQTSVELTYYLLMEEGEGGYYRAAPGGK